MFHSKDNKNMSPKISVITATYNRAYILHKAINSVLHQTFDNWEHIIVDDSSTDNTYEIVSRYMKNDPRIIYVKLNKNSGQGAALNKGIELANSPLIAFLDSDDELHPEYLKRQTEYFNAHPDIGLCYVGADYYSNNKKVRTLHTKTAGDVEGFLFNRFIGIGGSTFTVQKKVFDKVGMFDPEFPALKDYDFLVRVAKYFHFGYMEGCNTKMLLDSENRISDNRELVFKGRIMIYNKHKERGKEIGKFHHITRKMARQYALNKKDLVTAYKYLFEAVKYRPFYLYGYLYTFKLPILYFKSIKK